MDTRVLPRVSAVIITHDRCDLAVKAIESALAQTYENMEVIVVDDASTAENSDRIRAFAEERGVSYIYIPKEQSKGGNHARNVGAERADGELIAFLDDDDEWMPEKTAKQAAYLMNNRDHGVVSCLRVLEYNFKKRVNETAKYKIEGDIHNEIFTRIPFLTSTIMIRKQLLEEIGGFDENLRYWQEYDLAIRFCQKTQVYILKEHLCLYRIILKDKKRLSNNLEGWEEAVAYINHKYDDLIQQLPDDIKKKRSLLIAKDGQTRAKNAGLRKLELRYGWSVVKLKPSFRNIVKLMLSFFGFKW